MAELEIFPVHDGSGYRIRIDGVLQSEQRFAPGVPGFVPMTEAEATAHAQSEIDALNETPTE